MAICILTFHTSSRLDSYCNKLWVKEAASPLVILGAPGSGKSALLANWKLSLNSRPAYLHFQRGHEKEPFLFYHNVGCTRASTCVDQILRRLIGTLESNFKLSTPIPMDPKKLPWCLSTFLELSAAIRPIFVVIDGIHRLQSSDGDYDNLQWLPLCFPANVRFIISVTTTEMYQDYDKQKNSTGDEVLLELRNRKWPVMQLKPLDEARRRAILNCFLFKQRELCTSASTDVGGRRKDNSPSDFVRREMSAVNDMTADKELNYVSPSEVVWLDSEGRGLQLFPSMIDSIVSAEATSSVRYLRLLLHALEAGHIQGYNLQAMLGHLLQAKDVSALYLAVLEHFEKGYFPVTRECTTAVAAAADSETSLGKHTKSSCLDLSKVKDGKELTSPMASLENECRRLVVNKEQSSSSLTEVHQFQETKKECTITIDSNQDVHDESSYPDESGAAFQAADEGKEESTEPFRKAQTMSELTHQNIRAPISKAGSRLGNGPLTTYSSKEEICTSEVPPLSLCGGSRQASDPLLISMLKKALSLVYSSRHGLQESELWDMLCTLSEREAAAAMKDVETDVVNHLAFRLMQKRGRLMDLLRDMDKDKNGTVDIHEFKNGLEALGLHLDDQQMQDIAKGIDTDGNGHLDFDEIVERYGTAVRRTLVVGRHTVVPSFLAQQNENEIGETVANVGHHEDGTDRAQNRLVLSEELKKVLVCIMRGLGVSYHPNYSLFLLGFDCEDFRSIIHRRYIGDGRLLWHRRFVRYFSPLSPSVRRCEELPWHLRKCYRWGGLKSTLTDIPTFHIMWKHDQLKRELISYWLELTQGLLWKNEDHEKMTKLSETAQPSLLKRLAVKRGSKYILNDDHIAAASSASRSLNDNTKVTCFDIFDGYNKAVEVWQAAEMPTMQDLGKTVGMIGELMIEMSAQLQDHHSTIPPFLHYPIDIKDLERLGISGIFSKHASPTVATKQKSGHHPIHKLKGDGNRDAADQKIKGMDRGGPVSIHRWNQSKQRVAELNQISLIKFQDHIETIRRLSEPRRRGSRLFPEHLEVPSHYFQRWIWVQFPWLALVNAIDPRRETITTKEDYGNDVVLSSKNIIPTKKVGSSKESVNKMSSNTMTRLGPVRGMIDASPMNKKQGVKNVGSGIYSDISTSNCITPDGVLKNAGSGLDPTIAPQPIQNNPSDGQRFMRHKNYLSGSGGAIRGLPNNKSSVSHNHHEGLAGDCIDKNTKTAATWSSSKDFGGIMAEPPTSAMSPPPEELVVQKAQAKAKGLRNILDGLSKERNEKSQILKNLSMLIQLNDSKDVHTASEAAAGEKVLSALQAKSNAATGAVEDTRELRSFLECIIDTCKKNPPQEKQHLSALEHQVKLAGQQMKDLVTHMCPVLEETNEIEEKGIQGFREHLTRVRKVRAQVEERTNKLRANIEHIMAERKMNEAESHHHVPGLKVPMFAMRVKRLTSAFTSAAKTQKEGMASVLHISKEVAPAEDRNGANIICTTPQPVYANALVQHWATTSSTAARREESNDSENGNAVEDSLICALDELIVSTGAKDVEELPSIVQGSLDTERGLMLNIERLSHQAEELRNELKSSQEELSKIKAVGLDAENINGVSNTLGQDLWALEAVSIKGKNITSRVSQRTVDKDIEAANIRYQQACECLSCAQSLLSEVMSSIEHIEKLCDTILPPQLEAPTLTMVAGTDTSTTSGVGLEAPNSVRCLKNTTERLLALMNSSANSIICPPLQSPENESNDALPSFWVSGFSPGRVRAEATSVNALDVCTTLDRAFSIETELGKEGFEASSCDIHVMAEKYRDLRFQTTTDLQIECQDDGALLTTEAEEKKLDANLRGTPPLIEALRSSESMNLLRKANILMPSAVQSGQQHSTYGLVIDHLIQASQAE